MESNETFNENRPYGHFPTIESLEEQKTHLSSLPADDDIREDIEFISSEIAYRYANHLN